MRSPRPDAETSNCHLDTSNETKTRELTRPNKGMSFSSRRRNYLLTPHRRDGLIEWYVKDGRDSIIFRDQLKVDWCQSSVASAFGT